MRDPRKDPSKDPSVGGSYRDPAGEENRVFPNPVTIAGNLPGAVGSTVESLIDLAVPSGQYSNLPSTQAEVESFWASYDPNQELSVSVMGRPQYDPGLTHAQESLIGVGKDLFDYATDRPENLSQSVLYQRYPHLSSAVASTLSPLESQSTFVTHLEEEPDWALDIALAPIGATLGMARQASRLSRGLDRVLDVVRPFDEDVLDPVLPDPVLPDPVRRGDALSVRRRLERWQHEQYGESTWTHTISDLTQNAALVSSAAEATVEAVRVAAGHELNPGGLIRAGVESAVAVGAHVVDRRFGGYGILPDEVPDFNARRAAMEGEALLTGGEHLRRIFEDAGAEGLAWNRGSLSNELARYEYDDLVGMFGEAGAEYLTSHAEASRRWGQRSYQTRRNWGESFFGLVTGDIPRADRYVYDPEARSVDVSQPRRWTLDRLLEASGDRFFPLSAWRERREQLRASPREDRLSRILGPLQPEDATPHIGYMMIPEARGLGRFWGRYHAEPPVDKQLIKNWGLEDIAQGVGAENFADAIRSRKDFRAEREAIFEERRLNPELYQWQDPDHYYQELSQAMSLMEPLGFEGFGRNALGSPYSRWGRFGSRLPAGAKYPLIGAGAAVAGTLGYGLFSDDDDETLRLEDPSNYSMSPRYPLLSAVQRTTPFRRLRARGEQFLDETYGEGSFHSEMMQAIVLGNRTNLPDDIKETFEKTGQIHALVQSGMHVSMASRLLGRYPGLALPAVGSAVKDFIDPPNEEVVEPSDPWSARYQLSPSPWAPRFNPARHERPKDFELPFWAWWDPDSDRAYHHQMSMFGGHERMDRGYLYRLTNMETDESYVGLSTRHPQGKDGRSRIGKHLSGRGSKSIAEALETYDPSDFSQEVWELENPTYTELGSLERYMIKASGGAYNRSPGGEIQTPRETERAFGLTTDTQLQDILPWGVYSALGVLPEAGYSYFNQEAIRLEAHQVEVPDLRMLGVEDLKVYPPVDINTATVSEFDRLPRIGPKTAERIISSRDATGFQSIADLQSVRGIGPKTYQSIAPYLQIGAGPQTVEIPPVDFTPQLIDARTPHRHPIPYALPEKYQSQVEADTRSGGYSLYVPSSDTALPDETFTPEEKSELREFVQARLTYKRMPNIYRDFQVRADTPQIAREAYIPEESRLDINIASEAMLREVPGISRSEAEDIVRYRETVGPYQVFPERFEKEQRYFKSVGSTGEAELFDAFPSLRIQRDATFQDTLLDINTATAAEFEALPGIGQVTAERIIADREAQGQFPSLQSLTRVRGIGDDTVERMRPGLQPFGLSSHPDVGIQESDPYDLPLPGDPRIGHATPFDIPIPGYERPYEYPDDMRDHIPLGGRPDAPLYDSLGITEVPLESGFEYSLRKFQEAQGGATVFRDPSSNDEAYSGRRGRRYRDLEAGLQAELQYLPRRALRHYTRHGTEGLGEMLMSYPGEALQRQGVRVAKNYAWDALRSGFTGQEMPGLEHYLGDTLGGAVKGAFSNPVGAVAGGVGIAALTAYIGESSLDANYADVIEHEGTREQRFYDRFRENPPTRAVEIGGKALQPGGLEKLIESIVLRLLAEGTGDISDKLVTKIGRKLNIQTRRGQV